MRNWMKYLATGLPLRSVLIDIIEWVFATLKHRQDKFRNVPNRVKLVAIAKNEAAYLPEWIAHHLYFGFDHIEVNVNRTSDNTFSVLEKLAKHSQVTIKLADDFFSQHQTNPQSQLYKQAVKEARASGFSHVCFLDIDEFWVPRDLTSSIHNCIESIGKCDVISFEWANKIEPTSLFGPALSESVNIERFAQIKSIIDTYTPIFRINPHSVVSRFLHFRDANGNCFQHSNKFLSKTTNSELKKALKPYFILHRFYRSEVEYIALLGRGRPEFLSQGKDQIKNNRKGYGGKNSVEPITFNSKALNKYRQFIDDLRSDMLDIDRVKESQDFVLNTYQNVLNIIKQSDISEMNTIKRSLSNITDEKTLAALEAFLAKTG